MGPESGWLSATTIGSGAVALAAFVAFVVVERTAENPIMPFSLFFDRNRLATFAAMFLAGGVMFTLILLVTLYVQSIMGYSPLRTGYRLHPVRHRDGHRGGCVVAAGDRGSRRGWW